MADEGKKDERKESEKTTPESAADQESKEEKKPDKIARVTKTVLIIALLIFIWQLFADRFTPYTDQARVQSLVVPLVPKVSGYITSINTTLHDVVEPGEELFQIDKKVYKMAVDAAEAELDYAAQQVGALTAAVKSVSAYRGVALANLDRAQRDYDRIKRVLEETPGSLSQADRDHAETALAQAIESVAASEADLERAKQQLGITGPNNPQLRAAVVKLEKAQLNLAYTTIHAPSRGVIENFNVDIGHFSNAGAPLATFISMSDAWLSADMRENCIGNIKIGDDVEFVLDLAPGKVFTGTVRSVGFGVKSNASTRGDLVTVSKSSGWLREQQRFPVIIGMDQEAFKLVRMGGQAEVTVYTEVILFLIHLPGCK